MPKKKTPEQIYEEQMQIFVNQLKQAGVTDETVKKVVEEIQDYQKKEMERQLNDIFGRWQEIIKEAMLRDE